MQTDIDTNLIVALYGQGYNCAEIGRRFGISRATIRSRLVSLGVAIRHVSNKRLICNSSFFLQIDSPAKAQALGLVYADGCIAMTRNSKTFILSLAAKDFSYLESFRRLIGFSGELKRQGGKDGLFPYYALRIYDSELYDNLVKCGVTERKSLTLTFPNKTIVKEDFVRSFVLGYFEGDGSVSFNPTKKRASASIVASHSMASTMKTLIENVLGIHVGIESPKSSPDISVIRVGGNRQVLAFLDWLYDGSDPTFRLTRKYEKYQELKIFLDSLGVQTRGHRPKHSDISAHPKCISLA